MSKDFEIKNAEEQLRQAMLASDIKALNGLLADELIFTNHLGQCLGKTADLAVHESGALRIAKLETSEQQIRLIGDKSAIVSVRARVVGTYAGQPAGGDFRFTRVWALAPDNRWQVVAAHSSIVA
jgi:ketosteroid isomerase-like protein